MDHEESHEHVPAEDEDLRKVVMEMRDDDENLDGKEYKVAR
jgi:hypothetical protein